MPPPIPTRVGRYEIVDRLGAGGMGVVYLATDPLLRRTVAIKVLPAHDEDLRERFAREARSAAALRHNHVVTIYDIGDDDGKPFIAMEFLDGESISEMVRRRAALSIDRRLQLMLELCSGLGYAHKSGIVHRDIKPGNLMVTAEGTLKILDFGLARITSEASSAGLTQVGSVLGTPHYMSPEQVEGKVADTRSDIFSVGVVFYELLTYQKAYPGDSAHVVLHNIVHLAPTPIRNLLPGIDPALEAIVNKGLEKDPAARYQDLSALAADLTRVRSSLTAGAEFETMIGPGPDSRPRSKTSKPADTTPGRGTRHLASLDVIAQRRAAQVEAHLLVAGQHFAAGRFLETIEACENAVLLDADNEGALELLAQAQAALDEHQVQECLVEARACLSSGDLTRAAALIEQSLKLRSDSAEAQELERQLKEQRRDRERAAERARATQAAVERARRNFDDGAYEAAVRAASEALAHDATNHDALNIKERAAAATEERRRQEEHDAQAQDIVARARQMLEQDPAAAAALLEGFSPQHPLVDGALGGAKARLAEIERQRRAEEERQRHETEAAAIEQRRLREQEEREAAQRAEEEAAQRAEEEARRRHEAARQAEESNRREEEARRSRAEKDARPAAPSEVPAGTADPADDFTVQLSADAMAKALAEAQAIRVKRESERRPAQPQQPPLRSSPKIADVSPVPVAPPIPVAAPVSVPVAARRPPTVKPLWLGLAAAAILVTSIGVWLSTRSADTDADAAAAAEAVPATLEGNYQDAIENARQRYTAADIDGAVSIALSVPESAPERAQALQLLETMRSDSAARAAAEQQAAQASATVDEELIQQGTVKVDEAETLSQPADTARVIALYEEAITLFRQAPVSGWSADRLVSEAQEQLAAKKQAPAVDFALQALTVEPDHAGAVELLQSIKDAAAAAAVNASRRARTAGATDANSAGFREGRAKEADARALRAPEATKEALSLYDAATAAYRSASIDAPSPPTPAPVVTPPAAPTAAALAQGHLQRAEERLAAGDLTSADNAIREAEKLDPKNPRLAELKKLADARRAALVAPLPPPKPGEIEKIIADSARLRNDVEAIKFLTDQQGRFPGNPAISTALASRRQVRDNRISDLEKRARGANDERAIEFLDSALTLDPARTDIRNERERRARNIVRIQTERSVRDVLNKFESAFEARNVAQFVNIATYRTAADIGQEFQAYRSIRMDIEGVAITVLPEGGASVRCTIRTVREPANRGKPVTDAGPWLLKIVDTGGKWQVIEAAPAR